MNYKTCQYYINPNNFTTSEDNSDYLALGSYGKVRRVYSKQYGVSAAKIFMVTGTSDSQK